MPRKGEHFYPVAPLIELADKRVQYRRTHTGPGLVDLIGENAARAFIRAQRHDTISSGLADRLAIAFGVMPWELWPSWFDDAGVDDAL
jgi:hypothetical protein